MDELPAGKLGRRDGEGDDGVAVAVGMNEEMAKLPLVLPVT